MVQRWAGSRDLPRSDRTLGPQVPVLTTVTPFPFLCLCASLGNRGPPLSRFRPCACSFVLLTCPATVSSCRYRSLAAAGITTRAHRPTSLRARPPLGTLPSFIFTLRTSELTRGRPCRVTAPVTIFMAIQASVI